MRPRQFVIGIALLAIVAAAAVWLWPARRGPIGGRPADRVILVTIDTLRADHLSMYDYYWDTSPFLGRLASEGVLFKNAFVSMSTTAPSHASIFTGLYPVQHGVLKNGLRLDDRFVTLAELYQQMGYHTAGFISSKGQFDGANFEQGFDGLFIPDITIVKNETPPMESYRQARQTIDLAIEWLKGMGDDEPFFLWVHLFDPHLPLVPPDDIRAVAMAALQDPQAAAFLTDERHIDTGIYDDRPSEMIERIAEYDAEIRNVDAQIQRLHEFVAAQPNRLNTVWVVTADHGEGLGSHRWYGHGKHVYNEQLRAPIILWSQDMARRGTVIERPVENVDLFPTLIEMVAPDASPPKSEGESLFPLINDQPGRTYAKTYTLSQRRRFDEVPDEPYDPATVKYEPGDTFAIQTDRHKLIYRTEGDDQLFDLVEDPYELVNVIDDAPSIERMLRETLNKKLERLYKEAATDLQEVDAETLEQLKSLGYTR